MHAAFSYNVVTVTDAAVLVDTGSQGQRVVAGDLPAGSVVPIEVQHDAVPAPTWTVEDQPFGVAACPDHDGVTGGQPLGNVGGGRRCQVSFQPPPVAELIQDAQFSPRNMSMSVPVRWRVGSQ